MHRVGVHLADGLDAKLVLELRVAERSAVDIQPGPARVAPTKCRRASRVPSPNVDAETNYAEESLETFYWMVKNK